MNARATLLVLKKELKAYFYSPVAYIVIVIFLGGSGALFFSPFFLIGRADLRDFFSLLPVTFALIIPAITMRTYSEEFGSGSYEILYTLPISAIEILIGKYLATVSLVLLMLLPTVSYPFWIASFGEIDWGPVAGGYLGAILLAAAYCAIGVLTSSFTRNQIVAFIIAIAVCLFLYIIDKVLILLPAFAVGVLQSLSADYHFRNIAKGVVDTRDIVYFLSVIVVALMATRATIEERT